MANMYSGGITDYNEGNYQFVYYGEELGIHWKEKSEEEYEPLVFAERMLEGEELELFERALENARNTFRATYKPPVES